jgi:ribose transport system permease protein
MKRIVGLVVINIILIVVLKLTTPYFLTVDNILVLVNNLALEAIVLGGYTLLLISGHFDLSVDGIVALTGITVGLLMVNGIAWPLAIFIALCVAALVGVINGFVVVKIGINGLIATLTTWWICIGVTYGMTRAIAPFGFPEVFQAIGQTKFLGFRTAVLVAIIVIVILSIILHFHKTGAHIYAVGDNKQSSAMMGINATKLGIKLYVLVALLAGFVAILLTSRNNAASPMAVDGMALRVIAAVVIGGGNLSGGKGTIIGGLLGLCIMGILGNAIIQWGISPYWQKSLLGGVLLAAVLSERLKLITRSVRNV